MKVIVFLTEPASYAIDLIEKVYMPNNIEFKFLSSYSYSKPKISESFNDNLFINKLSIIRRFKSIKKDYLENDIILFSGYSSFSFIILWLIHTFSNVKKPICIISDTPLKIPVLSFFIFFKLLLFGKAFISASLTNF